VGGRTKGDGAGRWGGSEYRERSGVTSAADGGLLRSDSFPTRLNAGKDTENGWRAERPATQRLQEEEAGKTAERETHTRRDLARHGYIVPFGLIFFRARDSLILGSLPLPPFLCALGNNGLFGTFPK
jgi:hypothetical protein